MPDIFIGGRLRGIIYIALLAILQAFSAGIVAFATRDIFSSFNQTENIVPVLPLMLFAIGGLCITFLRVLEKYISEDVGQNYAADLRISLYKCISNFSASDYSNKRLGPLAIRFIGDLSAIKSWVGLGISKSVSVAIVFPLSIIVLYLLDELFALIVMIPTLITLTVVALYAPKLESYHRELRKKRGKISSDLTERIPIANQLRLLGRQNKELKRLYENSCSLREAAVLRKKNFALLRAVPDVGITICGVLLLFAAYMSGATTGEAAAALALLGILAMPLKDTANIWNRYAAWKIAKEKCNSIFACGINNESDIDSIRSFDVDKKINVQLLNIFKNDLSNINISIVSGEFIALDGNNGSGKSSILKLISGIESPDLGEVLINDYPISDYSHKDINKVISFISKHTPILKGSFRKALTLDIQPRPDDETIEQLIIRFGLNNIYSRVGGLDGKISENGNNLSEGEILRIKMMRAYFKKPKLLLIDNSIKFLDDSGTHCLISLIKELQATTIIISNNPAITKEVDRIWYLNT